MTAARAELQPSQGGGPGVLIASTKRKGPEELSPPSKRRPAVPDAAASDEAAGRQDQRARAARGGGGGGSGGTLAQAGAAGASAAAQLERDATPPRRQLPQPLPPSPLQQQAAPHHHQQQQQQQHQHQQQQQQPHAQQFGLQPLGLPEAQERGAPRGPLGHILTPVFHLLQQGSQQLVQHFGAPVAAGMVPSLAHAPQQLQRQGPTAQGAPQAQADGRGRAVPGAACATSTTSSATTAPESDASDAAGAGGRRAGAAARAAGPADSGADSDAEASGGDPGTCAAAAAVAPGAPEAEDEDEEDDWFDPLVFISRLPPALPPGAARPGALLPRQTRASARRKTLVLDLDETLVHSTLDDAPGGEGAHFHFAVQFNGAEHTVHVRMRPHMQEFLEHVAQLFEVVVFTASQRVYAEKLLNILDPQRRLIRHRIYRDSCVVVEGNYLKDLSGLGRDLAHTAIVDNSPQAFGFQVDNGIPIESWYDDAADTELLRLLPLMDELAGAEDVRPLLRERFRLRERVADAAATWRSRLEGDAAAALAWQQHQHHQQQCYLAAMQQQQQQQQQQQRHEEAEAEEQRHQEEQRQVAVGAAVGALVQQVLPVGQLRAAAAAAAAAAAQLV